MKTAKKIIIFIVCSVMLSLSFFSSAAAFSVDDLFEYGYVYDGVSYALPSGYPDPLISYPATLLSPEPNVPGFDPKKLPWSDAPSYIQDLIYMSLDGAQSTDASTYKMPFVLVRVSGTTAVVFVGYNVGLGYDLKNDRMRLCVTEYFYNNSACYRASFSATDYSLIDDWRKLEANQWGSEDYTYVKSYTSTLAYPSSTYDFYMYGGNGVRVGYFTSVTFPLHDTGDGQCYFTANNDVGFQNGRFFYGQDATTTVIYCETFIPPTVDQQEQETQKGIWQSIKDIPSQIGAFFDKLINYMLYFQETKPERQPSFSSIEALWDVIDFIHDKLGFVEEFIDDTLQDFEDTLLYIRSGSYVIDTIVEQFPFFGVIIAVLVLVLVIRKAVGR